VSGHDDYAAEPVPGLPERLPAGERLLWQGAPHWGDLAVRAFHVRKVAIYFGILMAWRGGAILARDGDPATALVAGLSLAPLALAAIALLAFAAWMTARATLYTITDRRVVMRIGVALTKTINIPFKVIETASLQAGSNGRGDIALALVKPNRIGLFHLWPNARPWHVNAPQPSLRAIADVATVAGLLGRAMQAELAPEGAASREPVRPAVIQDTSTAAGAYPAAGLPA
jgi:hypothetical protein